MKRATLKQKAGAIRWWSDRRRRYDFVRQHLYQILALDIDGWPHMTGHQYYLTWLDLVYAAKDRGLYSLKTANCDVIANLYHKAIDVILEGDA